MSNGAYAASREQGAGTPVRKKKRPAASPDFLAGPATGNASVNQPVRPTRLPVQLAPEDRLAATGETTVGWLTRRYGMVMDSGWDPQQVPLTVIHDLATSGVDDGQLRRVLNVTAPLQERLTSRLLGPGAQGQAGVGVEAAGPASSASPLPRPQQAGLGIPSPGDVWESGKNVIGGIFTSEPMTAAGNILNWPVEHLIGRPLNVAAQYAAPVTDALNQVGIWVGEGDNPLERLQGTRFTNPKRRAVRAAPPSWETAWQRARQSGLGGAVTSLQGIRPEDPQYAQAVAVNGLFASFAMDPLLVAGKVGQGAKLARGVPVTGEMAKTLEGASGLQKATRTLIPAGGDLPRSRVAVATYQLMAKTPEKLAETSRARSAFEDIAKATSPTYLADRYRIGGKLPEILANESDPTRVRDWFVAATKGSLPEFRYDEITTKIAEHTQRYEGLKADVLAGRLPQETVQAQMDGLAVDTLNLQRMRDSSQVGMFVEEMPRETLAGWARQVIKRGAGDAPTQPLLQTPPTQLPGAAVRKVGHPVFELLGKFYQGHNRASDLTRSLFETMPRKGEQIAIDNLDDGRVYLERVGQLLRVPRADLDRLVDRYLTHSGSQEAYTVIDDLFKAGKTLHPEITNDMLRINKRANQSLFHVGDTPAGEEMHSATKLVDGKETAFPQPQLDSELITHFPVPDVDAIRDILSLTGSARRVLREAKIAPTSKGDEWLLDQARQHGVNPDLLVKAYQGGDTLVGAPVRVVGRRWSDSARLSRAFVSGAWVPSVLIRVGFLLRQTGEEAFALGASGLTSVLHPVEMFKAVRSKGEFALWAERPEEFLNRAARDVAKKQPTSAKVRFGDDSFLTDWRGELNQLKASEVAREYMHQAKIHGGGPEAADEVVKWLNNHPTGRSHWKAHEKIETDVEHYSRKGLDADPPTPEEITGIQRRWIEGIGRRVEDKTKGNHGLLTLLRNGEAKVSVDDYARMKYGGQIPSKVQDLLEEYTRWGQGGGPLPRSDLLTDLHMELGVPVTRSADGKPMIRLSINDDDDILPFLEGLPPEARPTWVKGTGFESGGASPRHQRFTALAMEWLNDKPLNGLLRMPAYRKFATGKYNWLRAAGHSDEAAKELAKQYALNRMKNVMYDYGEKSRFNDQMLVLSPFMNAQQQIMRRWLLDIPGRNGFLVGQANMARRAQLYFEGLKQLGVIHKNERDEWVTHIPGLDQAIYHMTDMLPGVTGVKVETDVPLERFTMLLNPSPGLGPVTQKALAELPWIRDQWDKDGFVGKSLNWLAPYGPESSLGPAWVNRLYTGVTKQPPPWEFGRSRKYSEYQWAGSKMDAIRLLDAKGFKDGLTRLEQINALPNSTAKTAALDQFYRDAEQLAADVYITRGLTGGVLPAQPNIYWPGQKESEAFKRKLSDVVGAPAGPDGTYTSEQSNARQNLTNEFLQKHPELKLFLFSKAPQVPFSDGTVATGTVFDYKSYMKELHQGIRKQWDAHEYMVVGAGANSYWHIQEEYQRAVNAAGSTAAERLENWHMVKEANQQRADDIDTLEDLNPDWDSWHRKTVESMRAKGGQPPPGWREDVAKDLFQVESEIKNHLAELDPDGELDLSGFDAARAKLREGLAQNPWMTQQKGPDGEVARYWRDVADPYYTDLEKLYEQAKTLPKGERAPIYEQIRAYKNNYQAPNGLPSPEKVAFQGLDRDAQAKQVAKWSTNPPGWLTDFQREQLGLPVDEKVSEFWSAMNQAEAQYREWRIKNNVSTSSGEWRDARETLDAWKQQVANANGLSSEVRMEEMAPFDRAVVTNQLTGSEWEPVKALLKTTKGALAAAGQDGRPAGIDSEYGMQLMGWFSQNMVKVLEADPSLIPKMERWGQIMDKDDPLVGIDLWRKWMFGAFR